VGRGQSKHWAATILCSYGSRCEGFWTQRHRLLMLGFIDDKTPMKTCPCSQALPAAARFRATVIPSAVGSIHTSTLLSAWTFALKRRIASVILSVASGLITCGTEDISGKGSVGVASPWTHLSLPQHVVNAHYTCDRSIDRSIDAQALVTCAANARRLRRTKTGIIMRWVRCCAVAL
jgi:hypothetical protein